MQSAKLGPNRFLLYLPNKNENLCGFIINCTRSYQKPFSDAKSYIFSGWLVYQTVEGLNT